MSVLVGKKAPDFTVPAVPGNGTIVDSYNFAEATKGKYALVIFYPLDFTFVCPSDLIALDLRLGKVQDLRMEVISVSLDSRSTPNAWRNTPVDKGGIGAVKYPSAAEVDHGIRKAYDAETAGGVARRGAFVIDKAGVIRA